MLTDKCKIDFQRWYKITYNVWSDVFYDMNSSMKFGIYVDFFDQYANDLYPNDDDITGYDLVVFKWRSKYASNVYEIDGDKIGDDVTIGKDKGYKTRKLARLNVIKQANTIYNENISNTSL
jgi:hypothetical protein